MLEVAKRDRVTVFLPADLPAVMPEIQEITAAIGVDTETTGLNPLVHRVVTLQFGTENTVYVLDCRPFYTMNAEEKEQFKHNLRTLFAHFHTCVLHNGKFDIEMLQYHFKLNLNGIIDTMLQEQVLHGIGLSPKENNGITVNMQDTAARYGIKVQKDLQKWSVDLDKRDDWYQPFPQDFIDYCAQDVRVPLQIHSFQYDLLLQRDLMHVASLENMCVAAIARLELDGCFVDVERWRNILALKEKQRDLLTSELQAIFDPIMQNIRQEAYEEDKLTFDAWSQALELCEVLLTEGYKENTDGLTWGAYKKRGIAQFRSEYPRPKTPKLDTSPVNLGSPVQLKTVLAAIGVNVEKTDKEHLAPYARDPRIKKLLEWKKLDKFISAFGENLLAKLGPDGRMHCTYNQAGAATGRMTCSKPNWQQLPSHEPDETSVRKCVVAEQGNVILTADFSNIELRILADITQDENMLDFFEKGGDLHSTTARLMFNLSDDIDPKIAELKPGLSYRSIAKTINFGLVYGMSAHSLAADLGITLHEAQNLVSTYFAAYPGVARWLKVNPQIIIDQGYSTTLAGRKRFFPQLQEPKFNKFSMSWEEYKIRMSTYRTLQGKYERRAKNTPIQGTSADITKYALVLLTRRIPDYVRLVAVVHDEIVLECPAEKSPAVAKLLSTCMYKACKKYLQYVYIPPIDVEIEKYWKKG
jgi:DNA polymerase-1